MTSYRLLLIIVLLSLSTISCDTNKLNNNVKYRTEFSDKTDNKHVVNKADKSSNKSTVNKSEEATSSRNIYKRAEVMNSRKGTTKIGHEGKMVLVSEKNPSLRGSEGSQSAKVPADVHKLNVFCLRGEINPVKK